MTTAQELVQVVATLTKTTGRRDHLIRKMHAEGASLREIAAAAGMTHSGVAKVLGRS